jgi:release factor glutamine methyltransferase
MTIAEARDRARRILSASAALAAGEQNTVNLDISIILSNALGLDRSRVFAHPEIELGDRESDFFAAIEQRERGIPVAYIVGEKEFWGLTFRVTPSVLIPKPDTEILVERAAEIIRMMEARGRAAATGTADTAPARAQTLRVLDVCTGSGCIAIALKHSCPGIDITATDISPEALDIAKENAQRILGTDGMIAFKEGDLRKGLPPVSDKEPAGYDLIVSNPPYVPTSVARELLSNGRSEPMLALDGGTDGLDLVRALVENVRKALAPGGELLIETGEYNAADAAAFMSERGFVGVTIHKDLADQDRVVEGTLP